jgi:hypothetical protein
VTILARSNQLASVRYIQRTAQLPLRQIPETVAGDENGGNPVFRFVDINGPSEYEPLTIRGLKEVRVRAARDYMLQQLDKEERRERRRRVSFSNHVENAQAV